MPRTLLLAIGKPFYSLPTALATLSEWVEHIILIPEAMNPEDFCRALRAAKLAPQGLALAGEGPYPELLAEAQRLHKALSLPVLILHEAPPAPPASGAEFGVLALRSTPEQTRRALLALGLALDTAPTVLASQAVASLVSEEAAKEGGVQEEAAPRVYTIDQLARLCDLPVKTMREHLSSGRLSAKPNPLGGTWTIRETELKRFLLENGLDTRGSEKPLRILIVDDENAVVSLIGSAIQFAGYNVHLDSADNGYDAMLKIGSTRPDLVILDVQMPGADGKMVLQAIRSNTHTSATRILVVSGNPGAVADMRQRGADDSLVKPFDLQSLLGKLETLLPSLGKRRVL